jgi:hypothetical protein
MSEKVQLTGGLEKTVAGSGWKKITSDLLLKGKAGLNDGLS